MSHDEISGKPFSPACERNREPILAVLREHFADRHHVLELGSGTGQHAVHFAAAMPWLTWQCSDRAEYLAGIRLWRDEARLANTPPPVELDVAVGPWPAPAPAGDVSRALTATTLRVPAHGSDAGAQPHARQSPASLAQSPREWKREQEQEHRQEQETGQEREPERTQAQEQAFGHAQGQPREQAPARFDAAFSANSLHIMGWPEVEAFFSGLDTALAADATLVVYGPFNTGGAFSSDSNRAFDASLRASDPRMGIRDFEAVDALARAIGLQLVDDAAMPANNRCLVWRRG